MQAAFLLYNGGRFLEHIDELLCIYPIFCTLSFLTGILPVRRCNQYCKFYGVAILFLKINFDCAHNV